MSLLLMILAAVVVAVLLALLVVKFVPLKMRWLVSLLLLGATVFLVYKIYNGVMEPINFNKDKRVRYAKVIKNLKLIRDAEVKYKEVYGTYTDNKDTLLTFIKNGQLAITETKNVEKTIELGGGITKDISVKVIDTVGYEPVLKYFEGKEYSTMFEVPGTKEQFELATGRVEKVAGLEVPVFEAKVSKKPILTGMNPSLIKQELEAIETDQIKGEFVSVGSLTEVTVGGNWPPYYDKGDAIAKKE
ncbi:MULTISPECIES: hypothetical protein [Tenacibaculum]|uniref:Uncharacterized protein n=1 Tax=Tenacibaculum discolor TaxID=361581 RepID=A0A2G1BXH5_9FLAO|nr:hypothetical protein [Tenacibaculum discolor]MDP2540780.1 hypothetical protein [Tenacibaculum discolor]PHN98733.1 hypothetical protein CSC81_04355 [Tenacibaculum discolor]RLK02179.1 hypothetical protein C8N27_1312 [Tenacibaculum discolor]